MPAPVDFFLRFAAFAICHSLLASDWWKGMIFRPPRAIPGWYRLGYNLLSIPLFFWVMAAWPSPPVLYVFPGSLYLLARGMQLALLLLAFRCLRQTGLGEFFGVPPGRPAPQRLVTSGCYAVVRHPLYLLCILFMALEPAPSIKWLMLAAMGGVYCGVAVRWEEQRLRERYGAVYEEYRQTVPAVIPKGLHPSRRDA